MMTNPGGHELAFQLPSLPERVWDALTNPAKLAKWFGENDLVPQVGRRFTIHPRQATGFDGPITGEVLAVEEPTRLVMRWRTASGDLVMTWLVEPGKGGTRLRVVQSSVLGPGRPHEATFVGAQDAYRALFDEQLRAFLRSGMLGRVQPPPRPKRPASMFEPAADPEPESSPVATFGAVPSGPDKRRAWEPRPHRGPDRQWPRGMIITIAAGVALAIGLGSWAVASDPPDSWGAPGPQGREISADIDAGVATTPSVGGTDGSGGPGGPGGPGGSSTGGPTGPGTTESATQPSALDSPAPTTAASPLPMTVDHVRQDITLLGYTAQITVTNPANQAQNWQNAKVTMTGVNLSVSNVDGEVTSDGDAAAPCFYPSPAGSTVPGGGGTLTFTFHVTAVAPGALSTISAATLNDPTC